jgi:cellobiose phosphorylase
MGRPDDLLHALSVINPIAVTEIVKNARLRQRNCYFSSSDAAFDDRYQASRDYDKLRDGKIAVEGGWRIYSSGPGIFTNLVIRYLFGIRQYFSFMEFDPILPGEFDGICLDLPHGGRKTRYHFTRSADAPQGIVVNGRALPAAGRTESPYRAGGLRVPKADFEASLNPTDNVVDITFADRG